MTGPPRLSPGVPHDDAPLEHEKTPAHFLVTAEYVKRKLGELPAPERHSRLKDLVVAVGAVAAAVVASIIFVDNRVAAQTDAGIKGHESRIVALEQQVPQLREEVFQGRLDTQALYKAVMEGRRQERLEKPLAPPAKDGGQ